MGNRGKVHATVLFVRDELVWVAEEMCTSLRCLHYESYPVIKSM